MNIAHNIGELIGNTPIIKLKSGIYAKCEFMNPTGSVKDRIGLGMIKQALKDGKINKYTKIIEPTSGNTGIAIASICASLGLNLTLCMPESMSIERRVLLKALGAKLALTPAKLGMQGSITKANELQKRTKNSICLRQFENKANPQAHIETTAIEILKDMDKDIDIFVAGVGTGGTISGVGKVLKKYIKNILIVAVEPKNSAVLSGEVPAPHKIQGIGAGFIPNNFDNTVVDEVVKIDENEAISMARALAKKEGLLVGISSGSNIVAALKLQRRYPNKNILTVLCDTGERYLAQGLYD